MVSSPTRKTVLQKHKISAPEQRDRQIYYAKILKFALIEQNFAISLTKYEFSGQFSIVWCT